MLPMALLADVIDHDAEYSGEWREGQYYGMQSIFQKTAIGLSIAAGSVLMYVGGAGEEPTVTGLRLLVAAAGAAALVAALLFMRYPLRDRAEKSQNVSAVG
jgi:Na+/melibiose symporter-like transporter